LEARVIHRAGTVDDDDLGGRCCAVACDCRCVPRRCDRRDRVHLAAARRQVLVLIDFDLEIRGGSHVSLLLWFLAMFGGNGTSATVMLSWPPAANAKSASSAAAPAGS